MYSISGRVGNRNIQIKVNKNKKMEQLSSTQIDIILSAVDFERIHEYMTEMSWTWGDNGIPSIDELKFQLRDMLFFPECGGRSSEFGGFEVRCNEADNLLVRFSDAFFFEEPILEYQFKFD